MPGSLRVGLWRNFADEDGQLIEFRYNTEPASPYLYFDRRESLCFGLVSRSGVTQDELKQLWSDNLQE